MFYVVSLYCFVRSLSGMQETGPTLKAAEYGMPMGRFANIAKSLFGATALKARLWVISWMARKRLWLAVPPMA